jgi:hypothetical protein
MWDIGLQVRKEKKSLKTSRRELGSSQGDVPISSYEESGLPQAWLGN